jgi:hypothetical protein
MDKRSEIVRTRLCHWKIRSPTVLSTRIHLYFENLRVYACTRYTLQPKYQRHISWICDLSLGCLGRNWAYHSLLHQHPTAGLWISILTFFVLNSSFLFRNVSIFFFLFLFFSFERSCHKWINWERHRRSSRIAGENNSKSSVNVWPRTDSSLLYFSCLYRRFCITRIARHPVFWHSRFRMRTTNIKNRWNCLRQYTTTFKKSFLKFFFSFLLSFSFRAPLFTCTLFFIAPRISATPT